MITASETSQGFIDGIVILPFAIGLGLIIIGWALFGPMAKFAVLFAVALVGQAIVLQFVEAGTQLRYQHYKSLEQIFSDTPIFFMGFLAVQSGIVLFAVITRWSQIITWLRRNFKSWQLLGIGLVFILTSATLSREIERYTLELVTATLFQFIGLVTVVLAIVAIPEELFAFWRNKYIQLISSEKTSRSRWLGDVDRYALLAAIWVIFAAGALNYFSYQQHPHVADEVGYLYQARFLAERAIALPAPPVYEAFEFYLMQLDGEAWYPVTPVGWPAALSIGVSLGIPWLVNPILGGLNILLVYIVVKRLYSIPFSRIAVLLLCLSPWYIFMSMSFMTHTLTLTCGLGAVLGVIHARHTGRLMWALMSGIALGVMSLIRPLEGALMAVLVGLWAIGFGGKRLGFISIGTMVAGAVLVGALVLPINRTLTGHAGVFPINVYTDELYGVNSNAYGFGPDRGMGWGIDPNPGHTPLDGLINTNLNLFSLNIELFGWVTGSLLLVAIYIFNGSFHKPDYLFMGVLFAVFAVFFFYYFSGGPDFGARYWYLMIIPLITLTVGGIKVLEKKITNITEEIYSLSGRVMAGVLVLAVISLVVFFPWRAIDKYFHYLNMTPDVQELALKYGFDNDLVLVQGDSHPDYSSAATYNPLDFSLPLPIYAWDRSADVRAAVLKSYIDRDVWIVAGPSLTGGSYQVIEGPMSADVLIKRGDAP